VGLVVLADIGRVGAGDGSLVAHPRDCAGGVQAAGEGDSNVLTDWERRQYFRHGTSLTARWPSCRIVMHYDVFLCESVGGARRCRPVTGRVAGAIGQFSPQKVSDRDHHLGFRPRWRRMSRSSCRRSVHFATRMTVHPAALRAFTRSMSVAHWSSDMRCKSPSYSKASICSGYPRSGCRVRLVVGQYTAGCTIGSGSPRAMSHSRRSVSIGESTSSRMSSAAASSFDLDLRYFVSETYSFSEVRENSGGVFQSPTAASPTWTNEVTEQR